MNLTTTKHGKTFWNVKAVLEEARKTARAHESTYQAIVRICGENNAFRIMRQLEIADWKNQDWSNPYE